MPDTATKAIPELPSTAAMPASSRGTGWLITGLTCSILAAIAITLLGLLVFPQFSEVFAGFGADLPLLTRLASRYYAAIWLAPPLVTLIYLFCPWRTHRALAAGVAGLLSLAGIPLVFVAIYLPIFNLSSVNRFFMELSLPVKGRELTSQLATRSVSGQQEYFSSARQEIHPVHVRGFATPGGPHREVC